MLLVCFHNMLLPKDFQEKGAVLLIDKEIGWTSFDAVRKIRSILKVKKVGHAGTLDPLATGLLIVCAGKKTKTINSYMGLEKEYTGVFEIGKTTPSFDLETQIEDVADISSVKKQDIYRLTEVFHGKIRQAPPIYSAIKIKGRRAYKFARSGEEVAIKEKEVEIDQFEITDINLPEISFRLTCSKGFYVRSLVRDIGEQLGVGAYLKELRRIRIGNFKVSDAIRISRLTVDN